MCFLHSLQRLQWSAVADQLKSPSVYVCICVCAYESKEEGDKERERVTKVLKFCTQKSHWSSLSDEKGEGKNSAIKHQNMRNVPLASTSEINVSKKDLPALILHQTMLTLTETVLNTSNWYCWQLTDHPTCKMTLVDGHDCHGYLFPSLFSKPSCKISCHTSG